MRILGLIAAALAAFFMVDPAFAQEVVTAPAGTTIAVGGVYHTVIEPLVLSTASVALTALLGWAASLFSKATHITVEAKWQSDLHTAAMTGVTAALHRLGVKADGLNITVKNQVVGDAANWILQSVPQAVAGLGLDKAPDKLRQIIESKLGTLAQTPGTIEVGKTSPSA